MRKIYKGINYDKTIIKVLILQGSPRANGNTAWMAEEYKKAAEAAGHEVTLVNVANYFTLCVQIQAPIQRMYCVNKPANVKKMEWVEKFIDRILDLGGEVKVEKHEARALCYDPVEYIKEDLKIQEPGVELLRKCMGSVCED